MTLAFILCVTLATLKARRFGICFEDMMILTAVVLGTSLFGAGALYIVVTYKPEQILKFIMQADFSFVKNGGLVFYGGLIGGIIGALWTTYILKLKKKDLEVCVIPYIPLGHAIGRIGCLMGGCCYGAEYDGFLAVHNQMLSADKTYFPIQLVEAMFDLIIMLILFRYSKKERRSYHILCLYLILYAVMRFVVEFFRGDEARGSYLLLSTSQWISLLLIFGCMVYKAIERHWIFSK